MKLTDTIRENGHVTQATAVHDGITYTLVREIGGLVPAKDNRFGFLPYLRDRDDEIHDRVVHVFRDGVEIFCAHRIDEACEVIKQMACKD